MADGIIFVVLGLLDREVGSINKYSAGVPSWTLLVMVAEDEVAVVAVVVVVTVVTVVAAVVGSGWEQAFATHMSEIGRDISRVRSMLCGSCGSIGRYATYDICKLTH